MPAAAAGRSLTWEGCLTVAIYHFSIKIISRGKGASAVAKAAYRAAEAIKSGYDGLTHDYTRKSGIVHKEILLPENAPLDYYDRSVLWNAVEKAERNVNAQLAREVEIALPVELTCEQNICLVREFVKRNFVDQGMCADICVHDRNDGNPHAHIMLTMRPIEPGALWGAKSKKEFVLDGNGEKIKLSSGRFKTRKVCTVDWNEQTKAEAWRSAWADAVNDALANENVPHRINHRSYLRQGIERIPNIHMGAAAAQMDRKGIATDRRDISQVIGDADRSFRAKAAYLIPSCQQGRIYIVLSVQK